MNDFSVSMFLYWARFSREYSMGAYVGGETTIGHLEGYDLDNPCLGFDAGHHTLFLQD